MLAMLFCFLLLGTTLAVGDVYDCVVIASEQLTSAAESVPACAEYNAALHEASASMDTSKCPDAQMGIDCED